MPNSPTDSRELADRLSAWARGDQRAPGNGGVATIVCEDTRATSWLADPATGLVGEDSVVLLRQGRSAAPLPDRPGHWVGVSGSLVEPGDEMEVAREFWIQTTDYLSVRYLGVAGPTVVRVQSTDDADAFLRDVEDAQRTGTFPEALLHPAVEVGDRCAVGRRGCTSAGLGGRLHIDADGVVRCSPHGCVLGGVGDDAAALGSRAIRASACGDACLSEAVMERLGQSPSLGRYLAALDSVRVMTMSVNAPWRVCGLGYSLLDAAAEPCAPNSDLLVLTSPRELVLYQGSTRRGFRVDRSVGQVLEALLTSGDDETAVQRLTAGGQHADPRFAIAAVREAFSKKGIKLGAAPAAAGNR